MVRLGTVLMAPKQCLFFLYVLKGSEGDAKLKF